MIINRSNGHWRKLSKTISGLGCLSVIQTFYAGTPDTVSGLLPSLIMNALLTLWQTSMASRDFTTPKEFEPYLGLNNNLLPAPPTQEFRNVVFLGWGADYDANIFKMLGSRRQN